MSRDPRTYNDPYEFNPSRFLGEHPEQDPRAFVFGFGRRICPGRFFIDNEIFLTITTTLAMLRITKVVDASGIEITPQIEFRGVAVT
jgi:cytochrome P450